MKEKPHKDKTILFLDIDGVMNCEIFYRERHRRRKLTISYWLWQILSKVKWLLNGCKYKSYHLSEYKENPKRKTFKYRFNRFSEETCKVRRSWLKELCNENNYHIVISSCWRTTFTTEEWDKAFNAFGFDWETVIGTTETRHTLRGDEIKDWIEKYGCANYVIIDDDSDMREDQKEHFFWCDHYSGLTPTTCYKIKRFLNNEK